MKFILIIEILFKNNIFFFKEFFFYRINSIKFNKKGIKNLKFKK